MTVIGYIRVSSDKQDLQKQEHLLLKYAQQHHLQIGNFIKVETSSYKNTRARRQIGPGILIHIPPGVHHETFNTGWEQMKLVAIYSPPGPEKQLAQLPDCRIVSAGQVATH